MSQSPWRSGVMFALVGPLVGLAIFLGLAAASGAIARTDMSLLDQALAMSSLAPMLLIGAYAVGAPGAFAVGVLMAHATQRGVHKAGSVAASLVIGAGISMLMIFALDEFVLPHPHGDSAPLLGLQMWLVTAGIGAASAAICSFFFLWRRDRRAAFVVPEA
jgi:hypothetical protein